MYFLFILLSFLGSFYYVFVYKQFDFYTLSFFSALIYFMPGYFGEVRDAYTFELIPLHEDCYIVYTIALFFNILFSFIYSNKKVNRRKFALRDNKNLIKYLCIIVFMGMFLSIVTHPELYIFKGELTKGELQEKLHKEGGRYEIFWTFGSVFLVTMAYTIKKNIYIFLGIIFLFLDLLLGGNRASLSFAILAVITIFLADSNQRLIMLILNKRYFLRILFVIFALLIFFIIKPLMPFITMGEISMFLEYYKNTDNNVFLEAISTTSEPFIIQTTLSETLKNNVKTDFLHPMDILANIIGGKNSLYPILKTENIYLDQKILFPGLPYGSAYNIFAFFWSSGGWFLLTAFIMIYNYIIGIGSYLLINTKGFLRVSIVVFFVVLSFYIHRNDLFVQINLQKRIILLSSIFYLASKIKISFNDKNTSKNS